MLLICFPQASWCSYRCIAISPENTKGSSSIVQRVSDTARNNEVSCIGSVCPLSEQKREREEAGGGGQLEWDDREAAGRLGFLCTVSEVPRQWGGQTRQSPLSTWEMRNAQTCREFLWVNVSQTDDNHREAKSQHGVKMLRVTPAFGWVWLGLKGAGARKLNFVEIQKDFIHTLLNALWRTFLNEPFVSYQVSQCLPLVL